MFAFYLGLTQYLCLIFYTYVPSPVVILQPGRNHWIHTFDNDFRIFMSFSFPRAITGCMIVSAVCQTVHVRHTVREVLHCLMYGNYGCGVIHPFLYHQRYVHIYAP